MFLEQYLFSQLTLTHTLSLCVIYRWGRCSSSPGCCFTCIFYWRCEGCGLESMFAVLWLDLCSWTWWLRRTHLDMKPSRWVELLISSRFHLGTVVERFTNKKRRLNAFYVPRWCHMFKHLPWGPLVLLIWNQMLFSFCVKSANFWKLLPAQYIFFSAERQT